MRVEVVTGDHTRALCSCTALTKTEMARRFIVQLCHIKFHARPILWLSIYLYAYRGWRDREIWKIRSDAHALQTLWQPDKTHCVPALQTQTCQCCSEEWSLSQSFVEQTITRCVRNIHRVLQRLQLLQDCPAHLNPNINKFYFTCSYHRISFYILYLFYTLYFNISY